MEKLTWAKMGYKAYAEAELDEMLVVTTVERTSHEKRLLATIEELRGRLANAVPRGGMAPGGLSL